MCGDGSKLRHNIVLALHTTISIINVNETHCRDEKIRFLGRLHKVFVTCDSNNANRYAVGAEGCGSLSRGSFLMIAYFVE